MQTSLVLIRHCESAVDPTADPDTWGLTDRGRGDAGRLAAQVDRPALVAAGPEQKMIESVGPLAAAAGLRTIVEPDLGESHSGGWVGEAADFEATVRAFLEDPGVAPAPGWEPAEAVVARMSSVIDQLVDRCGDIGPVAICSGGRALIAYLGATGVVPADELFDRWRSTRMPDVAVLTGEPGRWSAKQLFGESGEQT